jgi:hypothetical protein
MMSDSEKTINAGVERRFVPLEGLEVRAEDGGPKGIRGTAAVFNKGTVIAGLFEERIAPGAFDDALKGDDVRALFNHDPNFPLGRTSAETLTLRADSKALHYEVAELPKSRGDVLEAIERRDVTGNSFSFSIEADADVEWTDRSKEKKLPLRVIKRIGQLYDVGPVTFPAYEQTKVSARAEEQAREMAEAELPGPPPPADSDPGVDTRPYVDRERKLKVVEASLD